MNLARLYLVGFFLFSKPFPGERFLGKIESPSLVSIGKDQADLPEKDSIFPELSESFHMVGAGKETEQDRKEEKHLLKGKMRKDLILLLPIIPIFLAENLFPKNFLDLTKKSILVSLLRKIPVRFK